MFNNKERTHFCILIKPFTHDGHHHYSYNWRSMDKAFVDPSLTSPYSWRCPESVLYFIAEPFSIGRWNIESRNFPSSSVSQQCYFYKHWIDQGLDHRSIALLDVWRKHSYRYAISTANPYSIVYTFMGRITIFPPNLKVTLYYN